MTNKKQYSLGSSRETRTDLWSDVKRLFAENQLKIKYFHEIYKGLDKSYNISTHMQNDKCKHLLRRDNTFFRNSEHAYWFPRSQRRSLEAR